MYAFQLHRSPLSPCASRTAHPSRFANVQYRTVGTVHYTTYLGSLVVYIVVYLMDYLGRFGSYRFTYLVDSPVLSLRARKWTLSKGPGLAYSGA